MGMTLGQFREMTKDMTDDTPMVSQSSNSMEMGGAVTDAYVTIRGMEKRREHFRDAFDGTNYSSEVYHFNDDGEPVIYVRG